MARRRRPTRTLLGFFIGLALAYGLVALTGTWTPTLGLDLQGGTRITLIAEGSPSEDNLVEASQIIDQRVNGSGVSEAEVTTQGNQFVVVEIPGESPRDLRETVERQAQLRFRVVACSTVDGRCGGGAPATLDPSDPTATTSPGSGVTVDPSPTGSGGQGDKNGTGDKTGSANRAPVGFADKDGKKKKDGATESPTAEPSDEPTDEPVEPPQPAAGDYGDPLTWMDSPDQASVDAFQQYQCPARGDTALVEDEPDKPLVTCDEEGVKYLLSPALIEGTELSGADAGIPQQQLDWVVSLDFDSSGTDKFTEISRALYGTEKQFAIVLDGQVLSAPTMDAVITNGKAEISGNFNEASATSLATSLKFGALPIAFEPNPPVETVGPSLAGNQLSAGLLAGGVGLLLVMIYCLFYYRGLGLVVLASLGVAGAATYAMVLLLSESANFTLSLPGIAGLIVAVGITADSFIVYFERIRDEMRDGKSMPVAVEAGWARARNTCLAADAVSLLARGRPLHLRGRRGEGLRVRAGPLHADRPRGVLLVHPPDGLVAGEVLLLQQRPPLLRAQRGDARRRLHHHVHRAHGRREGLMGRFSRLGNDLYSGRRSIDFVGRRWLWYAASAVIVVIAVGGLVGRGLDYGIEFTGGAEFRVSLSSSQVSQDTADELREAVAGSGIDGAASPVVTTSGSEAILIQTEPLTGDESDRLSDVILETTGATTADLSQTELGASWGEEIAKRALLGLCVFLVLVVLFIWAYFREWKMSLAAFVALVHDVLITVGVYALSGFEVTPATVTGILTILGFSLYDTVVVFDKVRENTKNLREMKMGYAQAANLAINQTLVRSINTSIVALIPVGSILYVGAVQLGSGSLKDLALALFVGMAAGAYSSIFIATPLLAHMKAGETEVQQAERRAKARQRAMADRYSSVSAITGRGSALSGADGTAPVAPKAADHTPEEPAPSRPGVAGRGRVQPTAARPVTKSGSSGRNQPSRKPKSKRGRG